uniref:Uncharacterized protein n=1 Tax=Arundo donax TaxID=35708 RepID=A0A0A9BZR2_ARUDO
MVVLLFLSSAVAFSCGYGLGWGHGGLHLPMVYPSPLCSLLFVMASLWCSWMVPNVITE